jgi:hypothetical protein
MINLDHPKRDTARTEYRRDMFNSLRGFIRKFPDSDKLAKKKKTKYLYYLCVKHYHPFALRNTKGYDEYQFHYDLDNDPAFKKCVEIIKNNFTEELESIMLGVSGYNGEEDKQKYKSIDREAMASYIKVRKYSNGVLRRFEGQNRPGQTDTAGGSPPHRTGTTLPRIDEE